METVYTLNPLLKWTRILSIVHCKSVTPILFETNILLSLSQCYITFEYLLTYKSHSSNAQYIKQKYPMKMNGGILKQDAHAELNTQDK